MAMIRLATPADAAGIARVHVLSWQITYRGIIPDAYLDNFSIEERAQRWEQILQNLERQSFTYVAEATETEGEGDLTDRGIVGFASGGPSRSPEIAEFSGELWSIYLLPAQQRQGLGRQLFFQVVAALIAQGHTSMLLWVLRDNPARRFYEALGGHIIQEGTFEAGGAIIPEMAYGWDDLSQLHP